MMLIFWIDFIIGSVVIEHNFSEPSLLIQPHIHGLVFPPTQCFMLFGSNINFGTISGLIYKKKLMKKSLDFV